MQKKRVFSRLLAGSAVGLFNGLLGGGGGMVAVPALQKSGLAVKKAHATAIAVIFPASAISAVVYLLHGLLPLSLLLPTAIGVSLGGVLGAKLLSKLSTQKVTLVFAVVMLLAGLRMVV